MSLVFPLSHLVLTASIMAAVSLLLLFGAHPSFKMRSLGEIIVIAIVAGFSVLAWRSTGNTTVLNADPTPASSPNDVLCPVITYVLLGMYGAWRHPEEQYVRFAQTRAVLTLLSFVVNVITNDSSQKLERTVMKEQGYPRVAILWHGDHEARQNVTAENNKFRQVFEAFGRHQVHAEPAVYHDAFVDEVRQQLSDVDGVLVWVNPLQDGMNRTMLDDLLREVASQGVFVSTHPDVIMKMGTKDVLFHTRNMSWGGDIHRYTTSEDFRQHFPTRLAAGSSRVLKQQRGNNGIGVWRVEVLDGMASQGSDPVVRVLHAQRHSREQRMRFSKFLRQCDAYFVESGSMIDQPFSSPIPAGMIRCYLSQNEVVGFGHQYVTALLWPENGSEPLEPQPRVYYPQSQPEFQAVKRKMETEWVPQLQQLLEIETEALPLLWDADFLFGPKTATGEESYVLCEINVSSVYPFPDSAVPKLVQRAVTSIKRHRS